MRVVYVEARFAFTFFLVVAVSLCFVDPALCFCASAPISQTKCCSGMTFRRQKVVAGFRCEGFAVMHVASSPPLRRDTRYSRCSQLILSLKIDSICLQYIIAPTVSVPRPSPLNLSHVGRAARVCLVALALVGALVGRTTQ